MVQRHSFDPPDALLALRLSDGTAASTTTTKWYDLGTGYPMGNNTKQLPVLALDVIVQAVEFAATSSGTMVVTLYHTNDEDGSNPGQGNVGGGSTVSRVLRTLTGPANDGDHEILERVYSLLNGVKYRFIGVRVAFTGDAASKWSAWMAPVRGGFAG